MKTTIEIDTEDAFELQNVTAIVGKYLEKKSIPFTCIGHIGKKTFMVYVTDKNKHKIPEAMEKARELTVNQLASKKRKKQ